MLEVAGEGGGAESSEVLARRSRCSVRGGVGRSRTGRGAAGRCWDRCRVDRLRPRAAGVIGGGGCVRDDDAVSSTGGAALVSRCGRGSGWGSPRRHTSWRRSSWCRLVVVAGSFSGSVGRAVHEDLVAGVDQSVEQRLGDDGVREQLYQSWCRLLVRIVGFDGAVGDELVEVVALGGVKSRMAKSSTMRTGGRV